MILAAFDIGNTRTHAALFRGGRILSTRSWPTGTAPRGAAAWMGKAEAALTASVRPSGEAAVRRIVRAAGVPLSKMGADFPPAIRVRAKGAGTDRLANAAAAWERFHRACIVVDAGTAVTFDVVDGSGAFIGGMIAPGPALGAEALYRACALLPHVDPVRRPVEVGRSTADAIQAGLHWGARGLVEAGLREIRRSMGSRAPAIATGGAADVIADLADAVDPHLTLRGIVHSWTSRP